MELLIVCVILLAICAVPFVFSLGVLWGSRPGFGEKR
jgi:hypothetical protein